MTSNTSSSSNDGMEYEDLRLPMGADGFTVRRTNRGEILLANIDLDYIGKLLFESLFIHKYQALS